jgi:uncharacterized protein (TIGR02118 family)
MVKLIALYKHPNDAAHFDAYYRDTHVPLAKTLPGLLSYEVSRGPVIGSSGQSQYHLIATLSFESLIALQTALTSEEGKAVSEDLTNFATGGVDLLFYDAQTI